MARPAVKPRPLSPHLSIWRWGPAMLVSILHRVTGNGMAIVGLGLFLWFVGALASGPDAYATLVSWMTSPLGYVVLIGLTWAFLQHLMSGVRHFVLDIGAGYEVETNNRYATLLTVASVLLTVLVWAWILTR